MGERLAWIRHRLVPAALTAAGVTLVAAGLLTYTRPATAGTPVPTPIPTVLPSPARIAIPSFAPPGATSPAPVARVPTRIVVPALHIDLPVIPAPESETFPSCDVAEFVEPGSSGSSADLFSRPGLKGTTYLYAHARAGMFLPLLDQSRRDGGAALRGMLVQVYTSDDQVFLYEVTRVLPHQDNVSAVVGSGREQLALQTSEGPRKGQPGYTGLVLIVVAQPLSSSPVDHRTANPPPHPVACA